MKNKSKSNEKLLKILMRVSILFLIAAVSFCIFAMCKSVNQKQDAEQSRLENETELAKLQMPTFSPNEENESNDTSSEQTEENEVLSGDAVTANAQTGSTEKTTSTEKKIVVLDAGHGKSSSEMTKEEKKAEGYEYNESRGNWGEWRHYKNGTFGEDCHASGCTELSPANASCWYSMGNADRDTEPEINLNNAIAAQRYLESMGYEVRMTRTSNEQNPSMNKRVSYCFPDNDISQSPDAAVYICIHSNAGGGRGTSYISLSGPYKQSLISSDYISSSNSMGEIINNKVAAATALSKNSPIESPYLILFNKSPVPIAYMEIGFFDDDSDLSILKSSSDKIGKAIAEGVDEYLKNN